MTGGDLGEEREAVDVDRRVAVDRDVLAGELRLRLVGDRALGDHDTDPVGRDQQDDQHEHDDRQDPQAAVTPLGSVDSCHGNLRIRAGPYGRSPD